MRAFKLFGQVAIVTFTIFAAGIGIGVSGCDEGDDGNGVRERIEQIPVFAQGRDDLSFEILLPNYLPARTQEPPIISFSPPTSITMRFLGEAPAPGSGVPGPDVEVQEVLLSSVEPLQSWFATPVFSTTSVNGGEVRYRKQEGDSSSTMQIVGTTEMIQVSVSLQWVGKSSITTEMEEEAWRTFESLLDDA